MSKRWLVIFGVIALCGTPAWAEERQFVATLNGADEVPPVQTQGTGSATITVDTVNRHLQWEVRYEGLSGPLTASHFHCPATVTQNAPVSIPIAGAGAPSPLQGSTTMNESQMESLTTGLCYVNVHTAQHPTGEIRGQVKPR